MKIQSGIIRVKDGILVEPVMVENKYVNEMINGFNKRNLNLLSSECIDKFNKLTDKFIDSCCNGSEELMNDLISAFKLRAVGNRDIIASDIHNVHMKALDSIVDYENYMAILLELYLTIYDDIPLSNVPYQLDDNTRKGIKETIFVLTNELSIPMYSKIRELLSKYINTINVDRTMVELYNYYESKRCDNYNDIDYVKLLLDERRDIEALVIIACICYNNFGSDKRLQNVIL